MIIASLTTIPSRLPNIKTVMKSILEDQTVKPDLVYLNIPWKFKRTGETYDLSLIEYDHPKLKINRCEDYGPITKLLPTFESEQNNTDSVIIIIDDDRIYSSNFIEDMTNASDGCIVITADGTNDYNVIPPISDTNYYIPFFFAGVLIPVKVINFEDMKNFILKAIENENRYRGDDYVMGWYITTRKLPVNRIYNWFCIGDVNPVDGLSSTDGNPPTRYIVCYKHLRDETLKNVNTSQ